MLEMKYYFRLAITRKLKTLRFPCVYTITFINKYFKKVINLKNEFSKWQFLQVTKNA